MKKKNIFPDLTKEAYDQIVIRCNMTPREKKLADLRQQEYTLEECAELMDFSVSTINRIQKKLQRKMEQCMRL